MMEELFKEGAHLKGVDGLVAAADLAEATLTPAQLTTKNVLPPLGYHFA